MNAVIRKACCGDEKILAYIQTESWKAAFSGIVPDDVLAQYTEIKRVERMYAALLCESQLNGYVLETEGKAQCMAFWSASRETDLPGYAELICIHSLPERWHQGYGSRMMETVLDDIRSAGYEKVMLWVFEDNARASGFYKKLGFADSKRRKQSFGSTEMMLERRL